MAGSEVSDKERGEEVAKVSVALKPRGAEQALLRQLSVLKEELEHEKKRSEDYVTRLKYLQADFENYRKRIDREIRDIEEFSTSRFARKLLPILDELDLAIHAAASAEKSSLLEGVKMIRKNFSAALEGEGVKGIEAIGKAFNPAFHEAVEKVPGKKKDGDVIVEEIRKGYFIKDKVLRPSMVKVELGDVSESEEKKEGEPN